jgi:hypothetical protein
LFATSVGKALLYEKNTREMNHLEQKYKAKFNQLSESRIDSTTSTTTMQAVVQTVQEIEKKYQIRPQGFLAQISQHISLFDSIRLRELDWFVAMDINAKSSADVSWGNSSGNRGRGRSRAQGKELFEIAVFAGEFTGFDGNYRFVLSALDDLEDAMKVSGYYDLVEVVARPLNIESENSLSGEVSSAGSYGGEKAEFAIRVARKVAIQ